MVNIIAEKKAIPYILEYVQALTNKYDKLKVKMFSYADVLRVEGGLVVFVQRIPPISIINKLHGKCCIFGILNIEQLTRQCIMEDLKTEIDRKDVKLKVVLDYSPVNSEIFKKEFPDIQSIVLEFPPIIPPFLSQNKIFDVGFVGFLSPRRRFVLDELQRLGVYVKHIRTWGEERDKMIAQCKILLNIHFEEDYNIFESMRCTPWVLSNVTIVSEKSLKMESEWQYPFITWCSYDSLVNTVRKLI